MRIPALTLAAALVCLPGVAGAAVLSVVPGQTSVTVGDVVTVRVVLDSEGVAVNNAEARLSYSSALLEPMSVSKIGSVFTLWLDEPSYSTAAAAATFNGGVPTPGFTGSSGTAVTATFRAKAPGSASFALTDAAVRANDGYGTDVLRTTVGSSVTISAAAQAAPKPAPSATAAAASPVGITSDSHPDQSKWYSARDLRVLFQLPPGATAIQILTSRQKGATPTITYDPPIRDRKIAGLDDGTWYVYARARTSGGWGGVATYTVRIDATAPTIDGLSFRYDEVSRALTFGGAAADELSGVVSYEVSVDEGAPNTIGPDGIALARIPGGMTGAHTARLRVLDAAGNVATKEFAYEVAGIPAPQLVDYPAETSSDTPVVVRGTTVPGATVTVYARSADGVEVTATAVSEGDGTFSATIDSLDPGSYQLSAESMLTGGPLSEASLSVPLVVSDSAFIRIGSFAISGAAATMTVCVLVILSIALGVYEWFRIRRNRFRTAAQSLSQPVIRPAVAKPTAAPVPHVPPQRVATQPSRPSEPLARTPIVPSAPARVVHSASQREDASATYRMLLKYVRFLDEVATKRPLTPEESHMRTALEADLRRMH